MIVVFHVHMHSNCSATVTTCKNSLALDCTVIGIMQFASLGALTT